MELVSKIKMGEVSMAEVQVDQVTSDKMTTDIILLKAYVKSAKEEIHKISNSGNCSSHPELLKELQLTTNSVEENINNIFQDLCPDDSEDRDPNLNLIDLNDLLQNIRDLNFLLEEAESGEYGGN